MYNLTQTAAKNKSPEMILPVSRRAAAINKKAVSPAPPARPLSKPIGPNAAAFYLLLSVSSSESVLSKASVPATSAVGFFFLSVALTARM